MFNFRRSRPSQISPQPTAFKPTDTILERGINVLVKERNEHLAAMDQLSEIIKDAQTALDQHTRLYDALNNTLFNVNHPFDPFAHELADAVDADLSVDQPSDDERQAAAFASLPTAKAEPLDMPESVVFPVRLPSRIARRATAAEMAE